MKFIARLVREHKIKDVNGFQRFFTEYIASLGYRRPVLDNVEAITAKTLEKHLIKPVRINKRLASLLYLLLNNDISKILFPSEYYRKDIENVIGKRIIGPLEPEILIPFRIGNTIKLKHNPYEDEIESTNLYTKIYNIYCSNPKAVIIVSKFIEWRGFYNFIKTLEKVIEENKKLPPTYIVTAEPILEEIRTKYNITPIPTKSHAKILLIIYNNKRYCYLGSMNILSPSRQGDYLIMYPGLENYCIKYLLLSILNFNQSI